MDKDEAEHIIDSLIERGALEMTGVDKDGDVIYRVTEKCKDLFPELYYEHMKQTDDIAFSLWQKDLVDIRFTDDGHYISIAPNAAEKFVEHIENLTEDEKNVLYILANKTELDNS